MPIIDLISQDGQVLNTIVADEVFAESIAPGAWRHAAVKPEPDPPPEVRHVSVGAFFDRFGPLKWTILADTNPQVRAVVKDASVRSYIDLDNADLPEGLALLQAAGHTIDVEAVVGAPIRPEELP